MKNPLKQRILVTGGAGFIGSHLCERLRAEQHEVLCVDNFFTGSKRNVAHLLSDPYFELIRNDITSPLYLETDQIFNLACPASPVHYQNDPVQTTKVNVHGAINMLGLAKRLKIRILQASTSEVYGDPAVHPQIEFYSLDAGVMNTTAWRLMQVRRSLGYRLVNHLRRHLGPAVRKLRAVAVRGESLRRGRA